MRGELTIVSTWRMVLNIIVALWNLLFDSSLMQGKVLGGIHERQPCSGWTTWLHIFLRAALVLDWLLFVSGGCRCLIAQDLKLYLLPQGKIQFLETRKVAWSLRSFNFHCRQLRKPSFKANDIPIPASSTELSYSSMSENFNAAIPDSQSQETKGRALTVSSYGEAGQPLAFLIFSLPKNINNSNFFLSLLVLLGLIKLSSQRNT